MPGPEGVAWFLRGAHRRISKNHDKGLTEYMPRYLGQRRRLAKVNDLEKPRSGFYLFVFGGVAGARPPLRGGAEKP
jgi:hypothetical protein